uniref:Uncharacterized protein n=1 Tax=Cacopsylla melanoneura TaxID=428564 RepID=A0A8D8TV86_9HEMI
MRTKLRLASNSPSLLLYTMGISNIQYLPSTKVSPKMFTLNGNSTNNRRIPHTLTVQNEVWLAFQHISLKSIRTFFIADFGEKCKFSVSYFFLFLFNFQLSTFNFL